MQKLKTELKNIQRSSHDIAMSKGTFFPENVFFFCKENADISKTGPGTNKNFFWNYICVCTYARKFQVSSIILTSFRQGWGCP